jgi:hypothetical protein
MGPWPSEPADKTEWGVIVIPRRTAGRCPGLLAGILLLLVLPGCAEQRAQTELTALQADHDASELEFEELAEAFKPRFEAIVEAHPGTEAALTAKLWLLDQTYYERAAGTTQASSGRIADQIFVEYLDSRQLDKLIDHTLVFSTEQSERYFNRMIEESPHANVQAAGIYGLAEMNRWSSDEESQEEARGYLTRLQEDYADVHSRYTTYGALADASLHPHDPADLAIGKPAPEIVGTTYDGQPLKLSDFKGKVVIIDFWGDW